MFMFFVFLFFELRMQKCPLKTEIRDLFLHVNISKIYIVPGILENRYVAGEYF